MDKLESVLAELRTISAALDRLTVLLATRRDNVLRLSPGVYAVDWPAALDAEGRRVIGAGK